ncbi:putative Prolamin-like domain-containing protein [Rosa chinensis]|uniref:Putative Prolamin-like domain-containing protein n=1 Tax=Rosa chinensis TaxID=74649 RepID=A0A2P6RVI4_ROSCH|nr:protein DOWN-REGULATED IN DIF1 11 [Rosa chinensis]PRQ50434.1 putative Prolamin-like domain-containing protein [Rosa chinensis]
MARVDQNVFVKVSLVALFMSFAAAQDFVAYEVYNDATSPISVEVEVIDAYPPISPEDQDALPPEPSPGAYKKLKNCANKITADYAEEIYEGIFEGEPLTTDCCKALVHLGYDCHIQLVKFLLSSPELKEKASEVLPRSVQLWKACALVVDVDQSIAPSPF